MTYYEARRQARAILGPAADVEEAKSKAFPFRVGVMTKVDRGLPRFVIVAAAASWDEALEEARRRQE